MVFVYTGSETTGMWFPLSTGVGAGSDNFTAADWSMETLQCSSDIISTTFVPSGFMLTYLCQVHIYIHSLLSVCSMLSVQVYSNLCLALYAEHHTCIFIHFYINICILCKGPGAIQKWIILVFLLNIVIRWIKCWWRKGRETQVTVFVWRWTIKAALCNVCRVLKWFWPISIHIHPAGPKIHLSGCKPSQKQIFVSLL